ncbi:MAG TPA: hypothetical protein VFW65_25960 [Pseudonocardiaceae bacterium]|nr:hypothetical protein [Pseudonocardiaceae bacterium]
MVTAMFVGRLPNGMFPLGIVFVLHQSSGSYSATGAALAALMLGTTCSTPFRGRLVDRWGQSRVLVPLVLAQATAMAGVLFVISTRQSLLIVIPLVTAVGATSSTLGGSMRQLWPALVRLPGDLPAAYALQALLEDLISVAGPLVASVLLVVASPMVILVFAEVAALAGTTVFATAPTSRAAAGRRAASSSRLLGALSARGMRTLVVTLSAAGMVVGMLYIELPAFAQGKDSRAVGILLAVMAASSMVSGLYYGARTWESSVDRRYVWLAGIFAAAVVPLALASTTWQLGVLLVFVGIAYAPRVISAYILLDDLAPRDSLAEAYTWLVSANAGGVALGSAIAGPAVEQLGVRWALVGTGVCAVAGCVMAIVRRRSLIPIRQDGLSRHAAPDVS